ncbi:acyl carrier protein [Paenibacillus borealis]|uniref:Carrier domain-containing protein n=1 Tax=Paenibacillus borealis TaxID=160799 RepID=A0A089L677_PAEBO|nr:acyl carrier protein [Paenibacillus borealis]AIQ56956.1 hypothetical protein PBOR_08450 [Paenibacillus borealis]
MRKEVDQKIRTILSEMTNQDLDLLGEDFVLTRDLGFDSIRFIALIVNIENVFLINFDDKYLSIDKIDQYSLLLAYVCLMVSELKTNDSQSS